MKLLLTTLPLVTMPATLLAQRPDAAGTLAGAVVDAGSGEGLPGVRVVLEPIAAGVIASPERGRSPFLQATRSAVTSGQGEYRFAEISQGTYRLRFSRVGYRPTSVEVDFRGGTGSRVSVGLVVEPVVLEPVTITSVAPTHSVGRG